MIIKRAVAEDILDVLEARTDVDEDIMRQIAETIIGKLGIANKDETSFPVKFVK